MEKTSLTFYLPRKIFEKAKITALKEESTFSDLAVSSTLALIKENAFDPENTKPQNNVKTMVYLTAGEKQKIKLASARYASSISELVCQALEKYTGSKQGFPRREKQDGRRRPKPGKTTDGQKTSYTYRLTKENDDRLRFISAETGRTRKQLILEAVKSANEKDLLQKARTLAPMTERSSMSLTREELLSLKREAGKLGLTVFELLNSSLEQL